MAIPTHGAAVEVRNLLKTYRAGSASVIAIDDVTVSIAPGSVVAVSGPSGSGKSTLLHVIGALDGQDEGEVAVDGRTLSNLTQGQLTAYRRSIGFVFQRYHLLPGLTALDNVLAPVLPYRTAYDKAARATELLAEVGLAGREASLPSQLSGGQQQRVAIARALIGQPSLLLADEPTGNLDSHTGAEILELLLRIRDRRGMTVLIATHEQHVAARCDRLIRLTDGRIIDDIDLTKVERPQEAMQGVNGLRA